MKSRSGFILMRIIGKWGLFPNLSSRRCLLLITLGAIVLSGRKEWLNGKARLQLDWLMAR